MAQHCRFFVFVQFRLADALLSPERGGDQGTLFAHNVVQGYRGMCVILFFVFFCVMFVLLFRLNTSSSFGAVGANFHSRCFCFLISPPTMPVARGRFWHDFSLVFTPVFPFLSMRICLGIVPFLWFVCHRAFSAPPAMLAVRDRFFWGGRPFCGVCVSSNCFSSRFPGFIARPLEV